jgi:creatinine amidohydrolase/Fe(II)-dependent formamide hydrolase-like protein
MRLNRVWRESGTRVVHVATYHGGHGQRQWLLSNGHDDDAIGYHAGVADTSEFLHVHPAGVRRDRLTGPAAEPTGASGDAARADVAIGKVMVGLKVRQIVLAVKQLRAGR